MSDMTEIGVDVTGDLLKSLQQAVAVEVESSKARIVWRSDAHVGIASTRFTFPIARIVVDANFFLLEPLTQSFVIAHELAHFKSKDPIIVSFAPSALALVVGTISVQLSLRLNMAFGLIVLALGLGLISVATVYFGAFSERRADRYAATLVGLTPAIAALKELSASRTVRSAPANVLSNLEQRIGSMEQRLPAG